MKGNELIYHIYPENSCIYLPLWSQLKMSITVRVDFIGC